MTTLLVKSGAGAIVQANRAWTLGEKMVPTLADASTNVNIARTAVWEVTTAATSTGVPTWPAAVTYDSTTVTQNGVVWTARKPGYSSGATMDWAFSTIYIHYAVRAAVAGDRIAVSQAHAETLTTGSSWLIVGTIAAPLEVFCMNDGATPPTALATGATVTTGTTIVPVIQGALIMYGIEWNMGSGGNIISFNLDATNTAPMYFEQCKFRLNTTASSILQLGSESALNGCMITWKDCDLRMSAAGSLVRPRGCTFLWSGGTYLSGGATMTALFTPMASASLGRASKILVEDVDFSVLNTGFDLIATTNANGISVFRRCALPASWVGDLIGSTIEPGARAEMYDCDSGGSNIRMRIHDYAGTIDTEDVIVCTGGYTTHGTPVSWKMTGSASCAFPHAVLRGPEFGITNTAVGSGKTATVETLHDAVANINDGLFWIEVDYRGSSSTTLGSKASTRKGLIATATDLASSSVGWTTTGITNVNKQKAVTASFTPQKAAAIYARPCLAAALTTVYVDPKLLVA